MYPSSSVSTSATPLTPSRYPIVILAVVVGWFALGEVATQAWYLFQESKRSITQPWAVAWPTESDALSRGFLDFQERSFGDAEREVLRYESGRAATWRTPAGEQWTSFYLEWKPDHRLNQMDLVHNPTACLPAAGLSLVGVLPKTMQNVGSVPVIMHGWEFTQDGHRVYAFVATRWQRDFDLFSYERGIRRWMGNFWKAGVGNRGNPLQTIELVTSGYSSADAAQKAALNELTRLARQGSF